MTDNDALETQAWADTPVSKALTWIFGVVFVGLAVSMAVIRPFNPIFALFMGLMLLGAFELFRSHHKRKQQR